MDNHFIKNKLSELRKSKDLSQNELAKMLNVSNKLISKWECGGAIPDVSYLEKYSEIFNISIDAIIGKGIDDVDKLVDEISMANVVDKKVFRAKLLQIFAYITAILPIFVSMIAYIFMPDRIPAHFAGSMNIENITRWGSRGEVFLIGYAFALIGLPMAIIGHINYNKSRNTKTSKDKVQMIKTAKTLKVASIITSIIVTIVTIVILTKMYSISIAEGYARNGHISTVLVVSGLIATAMLCLFMSIIKPNMLFGVRISSTINDEENWRMTHNFASLYCAILCTVFAQLSVFIAGYLNGMVLIILIATVFPLLLAVPPIMYSVRLAKKKNLNQE